MNHLNILEQDRGFTDCLDVLNENWDFTWTIKRWQDIHECWDWHWALHLWIFNEENKILIRKRPQNKSVNPLKWDVGCWWHIFPWDNGLETAVKKALFELGINIAEKDINFLFVLNNKSIFNNWTYIDNEIFYVFSINIDTNDTKLNPKKEYMEDFRFIDIEELKNIIDNKDEDFIIRQTELDELIKYLKKSKKS